MVSIDRRTLFALIFGDLEHDQQQPFLESKTTAEGFEDAMCAFN